MRSKIVSDSFFLQDTVIDAGKFDGSLGIICALSALKVLNRTNGMERLKRPIEVSYFQST